MQGTFSYLVAKNLELASNWQTLQTEFATIV
jgi:hypothetical protein